MVVSKRRLTSRWQVVVVKYIYICVYIVIYIYMCVYVKYFFSSMLT